MRRHPLPLLLLLAACAPGELPTLTVDPLAAALTAEGSIDAQPTDAPAWAVRGVRSASGELVQIDGRTMAAVDPDLGVLHVIDTVTTADQVVDAGGEATRLVRVGDALAVTLRAEGAVAWFRHDGVSLVAGPRRVVGTEPFDVVASHARPRLYVSLSIDGAVVELDASTLTELRRWDVPGEPRWLDVIVDPTTGAETLSVAGARGDALHFIPLASGELVRHPLPPVVRTGLLGCPDVDLEVRITGAPTLGAGHHTLYVPTLYVDTELGMNPDGTVPASLDVCTPQPTAGAAPYGEPASLVEPSALGRFNPAIVAIDLTTPSHPSTPLAVGTLLTDFDDPFAALRVVRGFPTSVAVDRTRAGDTHLQVAVENSEAIVTLALDPAALRDGADTGSLVELTRSAVPARTPITSLVRTEAGRVWSWSLLSRALADFDGEAIQLAHDTTADFTAMGLLISASDFPGAARTIPLGAANLRTDIQLGRALFHTALQPTLSAAQSGLSCSNCHFEGRSDGLTWQFPDTPRQTPSLAGPISETAPFTWTGHVATLEDEVHNTTANRMGGTGATPEQARAIAAFIDFTRDVMAPEARDTSTAALVAEGRVLFESTRTGCTTCHTGERRTDGLNHAVLDGPSLQTPALVGLQGSAPYLHDGSADTLRAVLERAVDGSMGNTGNLTEHELDALEAYLKAL